MNQLDHTRPTKHRCSIVVCARWETMCVTEWLIYYASLGFDHVYLYCNDDDPQELYAEVLPFRSGPNPFVTFTHFPFQGQQRFIYLHFLKVHLLDSAWISFLDIDEFLFLPRDGDINKFLLRYDANCDAVYFNWLMFGNDGHVERPIGSVLEHYTHHQNHLHPNTKLIIRSSKIDISTLFGRIENFWHDWPNVLPAVRRVNVFGEDAADYYVGFPARAAEHVRTPEKLLQALEEGVICHFCMKSEADFKRRVDRGLGGEFKGQAAWGMHLDNGSYKDILAQFNVGEFTHLRTYWRNLHHTGAIPSVLGHASGSNIARGKKALQSSICEWSIIQDRAADAAGALSGTPRGRYQFCTAEEDDPWWQVDLEQLSTVTEIRLFNRLDSCPQRARHLRILVGVEENSLVEIFRKTDAQDFGGVDGFPLHLRITQGEPFQCRYIRIALIGRQFLHLDQVEVYGAPA